LPLGFEPIKQSSFFLRYSQCRHDYVCCHSRWLLIMERLEAEGAFLYHSSLALLSFVYLIRSIYYRLRNRKSGLLRRLPKGEGNWTRIQNSPRLTFYPL
jgi:hypothetical protein